MLAVLYEDLGELGMLGVTVVVNSRSDLYESKETKTFVVVRKQQNNNNTTRQPAWTLGTPSGGSLSMPHGALRQVEF